MREEAIEQMSDVLDVSLKIDEYKARGKDNGIIQMRDADVYNEGSSRRGSRKWADWSLL